MGTMRHVVGMASLIGVLALAGCVPPPEPELPDPILTCNELSGSISYDPPASNAGVDVTITSGPDVALDSCVSNTSALIDRAELRDVVAVLPGFTCGIVAAGQQLGSGTGRIFWGDGAVSRVQLDVVANGVANSWDLEFSFTKGRWSGATASVTMVAVSSAGNCVEVPVSSAFLANTSPFVVRP